MKIFLDTVGCRLNQSEIETFGRQFRAQGHTLTGDPRDADFAVINTCAVTTQAAADSRKKIRRASRKGAAEVVATGCWVTMSPEKAERLPEISQLVKNADKELLVSDLLRIPQEKFDLEPVSREPLPGARLRTRAFIKVQDGCNNRCTFCVTTLVRGEGVSRPVEDILDDIYAAVAGGAQEVVLTGVHLGSWGYDFEVPEQLTFLVKAILCRTEIPRLRLSSLEPWDLDSEFFALWKDEPRLCRHLHLPLQSGCDATLRRMARKTSQKSFRNLVYAARDVCPDFAITTDLIAGFPGETEEEFAETLSFVKQMQFADAHVFTFSERPGTAASQMPDKVPHPVRKERNAILREQVAESRTAYLSRHIGRRLEVLWESATGLGPEGWQITGLTDNYIRVNASADEDFWNEITSVRLTDIEDDVMVGEVIS